MIGNRVKSIGYKKDCNNRKYAVIKKNGDMIVRIFASEDDKLNIHNYNSNCVTNYDYKISNRNAINFSFNSYVKYVSEDFDRNNEELHGYITRFVYAYRLEGLILNSYNKFIKNNVMFSYHLKVDEIYENGVRYKYKT